jgi:hypothetical protein
MQISNNKPIWELQIQTIASYGPMRGQKVWSTISTGPGYGEDAMAWLRCNPWATGLGNMNLIVNHTPID